MTGVTTGPMDTRAIKRATATIPIVMAQDTDPVGNEFVASLARPGGNITGLSTLSPEISGKQLDLLKEILPQLARIAVLGTSTNPGNAQALKEIEAAARATGVELQYLDVRGLKTIDSAIEAASREHANAALALPSPVLALHQMQVAGRALKFRLPVVCNRREFVDHGGLMSYGASINHLFRRVNRISVGIQSFQPAYFVDRILKGAKPADLPVEQPIKFEFVINLNAAKQISLTIPPSVLARADKVIR